MSTAKEQRAKRIASLVGNCELNLNDDYIVYLDQQLAIGIKNCDESIDIEDSLHDVSRKIATHLDLPFRQFVNDYGFPEPTWKLPETSLKLPESTVNFSDLMEYRWSAADHLIWIWSKPHLEWMLKDATRKHGVTLKSIDTLRIFLRRCHAQIPMTSNAIVWEGKPDKTVGFTGGSSEKKTKELNSEKNANEFRRRQRDDNEKQTRIKNNLPGYLQIHLDASTCELCFKPTTFKVRLDEEKLQHPEYYDREIANLVAHGNYPQIVEGYSTQYCIDHAGTSSDRRSHENKRLHFYAAMRLIIEVQKIKNNSLPAQYWCCDDVRRYAFWLAYLPYSRSTFLKQLPEIVKNYIAFPFEYYLPKLNPELIRQETLKEQLVKLLQQLEFESNANEKWTTKCLEKLPRTCHMKYT